jgi:hypothetical protein
MNTTIIKVLALTIAFMSGAFAHRVYCKPPLNTVKMEITKSGKFIIQDGHIYELNELEVASKPFSEPTMPAYSDGASQSYRLPTGKK